MTFAITEAPAPPSDDIYVASRAAPVTAGFRVRQIASAGMLRVTMTGFWSRDILEAFAGEMLRGLAAIGTAPNQHLVLVDVSSAPIQSQYVYDALRGSVEDSATRPRRLAVVAGNTAARMQARRLIAGRDNARIFDCETEALRWLVERAA